MLLETMQMGAEFEYKLFFFRLIVHTVLSFLVCSNIFGTISSISQLRIFCLIFLYVFYTRKLYSTEFFIVSYERVTFLGYCDLCSSQMLLEKLLVLSVSSQLKFTMKVVLVRSYGANI